MIPNPIRKVLSTIRAHRVQVLLMGGQACVLYGAAEFSRDVDFALFAGAGNLQRLRLALAELQAECVALPPFDAKHLERGHAVHFRCRHPDAGGLRIDLMSKLRGVDGFPRLWRRRVTAKLGDDDVVEVLSLPDLVKAKKTQRDKDWPMVRRLVEADYFTRPPKPTEAQFKFWLTELRTPELLRELAKQRMSLALRWNGLRPLLRVALFESEASLEAALDEEMRREREADRAYWRPLKAELEQMRHARIGSSGPAAG